MTIQQPELNEPLLHSQEKNASYPHKGEAQDEFVITEHLLTIEQTEAKHNTNARTGLTSQQVERAFNKYGRNELTPPPKTPMWLQFLGHLTGFFSLLLWVAGFLCFIAYGLDNSSSENLYLGVVLCGVVVLTGIFSFLQDAKSQAVMEGFKNMLPPKCTVMRNGQSRDIDAALVVPGDVLVISTGQKIPADMRVVTHSDFKVDNSSLTGESEPLKRTEVNDEEDPMEATNLAFYGTNCNAGRATGIVVATGPRTTIGRIAELASSTDVVQTPIAIEIEHFIHIVSGVAVVLGVTFLIINQARGTEPIQNIVFAIGIIVANVPEGLLATVTVALTHTATAMGRKNVHVKNMEAVETLGSTTVIASDKTGTLTQNLMTVSHVFYDGKTQVALETPQQKLSFDRKAPSFQRLQAIATLCNNATFKGEEENLAKPIQQRLCNGDASESAFIKFCERITPILEMRGQNEELAQVPFNSANKYQISIRLQNNDWEKPRQLVMKGAPERILNRCDFYMHEGEQKPIDAAFMEKYQKSIAAMMNRGERVLGLCEAVLPVDSFPREFEYHTDGDYNFPTQKGEGLCFVGLISLIDPPREAVPNAVLTCQKAGIKVIMVTGDHPDTAEAIAKQVHIIRGKTRRDIAFENGQKIDEIDPKDPRIQAVVVTGTMLSEMTPKQLDEVLDFQQVVFARTSPKQKLIIVQGLQSKKFQRFHDKPDQQVRHVVAVTGDGVNDSPALKAADIGIAMGIVGSDVAKDAADMILMDDDFASIVDGVEEGRLIFDNLKKSIAYTLSSNIPEISPFMFYVLLGLPLPLSTVLILFIDLGTDMLPAISLAYENKEANIMENPPRDMNKDRLVTAKLVSFAYLQIGIIQAVAGFYSYFVVLKDAGFAPSLLIGLSQYWEDLDQYYTVPADGSLPYFTIDGEQRFTRECGIQNSACHDPDEALRFAQTSFFVAIIVVQWADILICKTRTLSIYHQGMRNNTLTFGLLFTLVLSCFFLYITPLNGPFGTRPLELVHWFNAMPFFCIIMAYDEVRKYLLRNNGKNNWLERNTLY